MFRRFNESKGYWRDNLSQIARLFLFVSFDIFLGLLVLLMSNYYLWLLIIYFVYLTHKYEKDRIIAVILIVILLFIICNRISPFNEYIKGEIKAVYYNGIQVDDYLIKTKTDQYQLGDLIEAKIKETDYFKKSKDGSFDEWCYFKGKGVCHVAYPIELKVVGHQFHLRNKAIEYIRNHCDKRLQGIYLYLLLGIKNDEIDNLNSMATSMAIVHIFAISGMHFSLLLKMIIAFLSHFMSEKKASLIALIIMAFYALCLEGNVAAWRAFFTLLFRKMGVENETENFGLVGIIFLLCNPYIYLQTSFIYSMSLYFLVILTKHIKYSSLFVYIGSMIISIYFRYEMTPLGFLFGMLFNQLISYLFPLFVLDVLTNCYLSSICFYIYQGLLSVMDYACKFSFHIVVGKPPAILIISFFLIYIYTLSQWDLYKKKHCFIYTIFVFVLILIHPYLNPLGKVIMLDVGQGDCFIISFPYNRETIMIDTGGLSYADVAIERIIPTLKFWGIRKIDTLYVSHQDFDHCGALQSLKNHYSVKRVVTDFVEARHQDILFKQLNKKIYDNENDNSLIIYTKLGGLNYLFTGDISDRIETSLITTYPTLDVDVLKVSHHGSETSSSNEFLQQITPLFSLISVGKNNQYGHPSKKVLNRLVAYGSVVKRTDLEGTVYIYFRDNQSYIEKIE